MYIHNCKVAFLFRQEPTEEKTYKPAEFHWKLDQVSDGFRMSCEIYLKPFILGFGCYGGAFYREYVNNSELFYFCIE